MGKGKLPLVPFGSRDFSLSHNAMLTGVKIQPEIRPNFSGSHSMETSFSWIFLRCPSLHSKRFRVIQGTRVRDRAKHRASKRAGRGWFLRWLSFSLSFHFSRGQNRKSRSSVFFNSGTKRKHGKRLLHRLATIQHLILFMNKNQKQLDKKWHRLFGNYHRWSRSLTGRVAYKSFPSCFKRGFTIVDVIRASRLGASFDYSY